MKILKERLFLHESILVLLSFFVLYVFTLSQNFSAAHDSISYINSIENGNYFHPHHLLYNLLAAKWIEIWQFFGFRVDSTLLVELLNAIFGSLTLSLIYSFLRTNILLNRLSAIIGTTLPAISFGFWFYSTTIEVYIIPLFFLILSFYLLAFKQITERTFVLIGITHAIAILFHQVHILFLPVVIFALFLQYKNNNISLLKSCIYYTLTLVFFISVPYLFVILIFMKLDSAGKIWYWVTAYAHNPDYWSGLSISTFIKAFIGFSRSVVGGHFIFAISYLNKLAGNILKGKWLMDEIFLVRNLGEITSYVLLGLSIILVLILSIGTIYRIRFWRSLWNEHTVVVGMLIVWLAIYTSFFLFWEPTNLEFWIPQSVICWLLFILLWSKSQSEINYVSIKSLLHLFVISVLLFIINFTGSIQWLTHKENDYYAVKIHTLVENAMDGDLIIVGRSWILNEYLKRYTKADILALSTMYSKEEDNKKAISFIKTSIDETLERGKKVLISGDAYKIELETIKSFGTGLSDFADEIWNSYRDSLLIIGNDIDKVYILGGD